MLLHDSGFLHDTGARIPGVRSSKYSTFEYWEGENWGEPGEEKSGEAVGGWEGDERASRRDEGRASARALSTSGEISMSKPASSKSSSLSKAKSSGLQVRIVRIVRIVRMRMSKCA